VVTNGSSLLFSENCREAMENGVVYMKDMGLFCEFSCVPVIMGWENGGFGIRINTEDEGFGKLFYI
jgi:hypothetical protein